MPDIEQHQPTFQFGVFELNPQTGELRKRGIKLKLQEQPLQILLQLLEHPGQVVTREEIQKRLWPADTYVDFDPAINNAIRKIREVLGDSPENPRFVETLARRGYRFIAPVCQAAGISSLQEIPSHFLHQTVPQPRNAPQRELVLKPEQIQWRPRHFAVGLVVLATMLAVTTLLWTTRTTHQTAEAEFQFIPLTSYPGTESGPSFSPDGTRVAFSWDGPQQDNLDIYVKLVGIGDPVRLTKDPAEDHDPAWSPDGSWIAFLRDLNDTERVILLIPAIGGPERTVTRLRIVKDALMITNSPLLSWSADGKSLFTLDPPNENVRAYAVTRVSVETGEKQQITFPPTKGLSELAVAASPDGHALAFTRHVNDAVMDLCVIALLPESLPVRAPEVVLSGARIEGIAWTPDGRELIFSGTVRGKEGLWRMAAFGPAHLRKLNGIGQTAVRMKRMGRSRGVTLATARGRLVYSQSMFDSNLWRMALTGSTKGKTARFISSTRDEIQPEYSPDGQKIAFESDRSGEEEIWVCNADGSAPFQVTKFNNGWSGSPRWSPDGGKIAFDRSEGKKWAVYVINSQGGKAIRLTGNGAESNNATPSWSRDGHWIYFMSDRTGRFEVWKMPATGGWQTQITKDEGNMPLESIDGKNLYYSRPGDPGNLTLWKFPVNGGEETKVLDHLLYPRAFAVAQYGIYFLEGTAVSWSPAGNSLNPTSPLRFFNFRTRRVTTMGLLPGANLAGRIAVSPDERWIVYGHDDGTGSDLMLVENFH